MSFALLPARIRVACSPSGNDDPVLQVRALGIAFISVASRPEKPHYHGT
jgi:hypothetical protein